MRTRVGRWGVSAFRLICLILAAAGTGAFGIPDRAGAEAPTFRAAPAALRAGETAAREEPLLKVMTLNVAHGRKRGLHQALRKRETIRSNLDEIAATLLRERPHVVALQEADGPSFWSGNFNHVEYLAKAAQFPHSFRGEHVRQLELSYGTAVLSRLPLSDCTSVTFPPSPPTFSKGLVVCSLDWPGEPGVEVNVVSVHLDFSRESVRQEQVETVVARLTEREKPLIVMGDLNCEWAGKDRSLRTLAEKIELSAYKPTAKGLDTFPKLKKRLDWILVSRELEFVRYKTLADKLSDHRGVVAVLRLTDWKN